MKKSVTDIQLDTRKPYEDQINVDNIMAKCEEFAKIGKNEQTGGILGHDPNSRHCLCCTMSLVCMKLGYTLNMEHTIKRAKDKLGINNFYSEYKREALDSLEQEYIGKLSSSVSGIEVSVLEKELISKFREELKAEVDVFALDFLERLKNNEHIKLKEVKDREGKSPSRYFLVSSTK